MSNSERDPFSVAAYISAGAGAVAMVYGMWVAHDVVTAVSGGVLVLSMWMMLMVLRIRRLEEKLAVRTAP